MNNPSTAKRPYDTLSLYQHLRRNAIVSAKDWDSMGNGAYASHAQQSRELARLLTRDIKEIPVSKVS